MVCFECHHFSEKSLASFSFWQRQITVRKYRADSAGNAVFFKLLAESAAVDSHDSGSSGLITGNIVQNPYKKGLLHFLNNLVVDIGGFALGVIVKKMNDGYGDIVAKRVDGVFAGQILGFGFGIAGSEVCAVHCWAVLIHSV